MLEAALAEPADPGARAVLAQQGVGERRRQHRERGGDREAQRDRLEPAVGGRQAERQEGEHRDQEARAGSPAAHRLPVAGVVEEVDGGHRADHGRLGAPAAPPQQDGPDDAHRQDRGQREQPPVAHLGLVEEAALRVLPGGPVRVVGQVLPGQVAQLLLLDTHRRRRDLLVVADDHHARRQVLVGLLRQVEDAHREAVLAIIEVHLEVVGGDGAPLVLVVLDLVLAEILGACRGRRQGERREHESHRDGAVPPPHAEVLSPAGSAWEPATPGPNPNHPTPQPARRCQDSGRRQASPWMRGPRATMHTNTPSAP